MFDYSFLKFLSSKTYFQITIVFRKHKNDSRHVFKNCFSNSFKNKNQINTRYKNE